MTADRATSEARLDNAIVNLHLGLQALQVFLTRGYAGESWGEAIERLELDLEERTALAEWVERTDLPSYLSAASVRRLRLSHAQAVVLGTAAVLYAMQLLCDEEVADDDPRVPLLIDSFGSLRDALIPRGEPAPGRLLERMATLEAVHRGEQVLPPLEDMSFSDLSVLPPWASPPPPKTPEPAIPSARIRQAARARARAGDAPKVTDLRSAVMAVRGWARDEGVHDPLLSTALRVLHLGEAERAAVRDGFSGLIGDLATLTPAAAEVRKYSEVTQRCLGVGVTAYGHMKLADFSRTRSRGALETLRQGTGPADDDLVEQREELTALRDLAAALLAELRPAPEERLYPEILGLRHRIDAALAPTALEVLADATVSGRLEAVSRAKPAEVSAPEIAEEVISQSHGKVVLQPTIGLALHGLDAWSQGKGFLPDVDRAVASLRFGEPLKERYARGRGALSGLDPEFDPVDLAEAELDEQGIVAAAMGTLVYAALVQGADPDEVQDIDLRAAETAEFAAYLLLCLDFEASTDFGELLVGLGRIRKQELERRATSRKLRPPRFRKRSVGSGSGFGERVKRRLPSGDTVSRVIRIGGALLVLGLGVAVGVRWWQTRVPPPTSYSSIVPISSMIRTPAFVTVRLHESQLGTTPEERAFTATKLWFRLSEEAEDPGLALNIHTTGGKPIATVRAGTVTWAKGEKRAP